MREIETEQITPKGSCSRGMGHIIADSWPLGDELGDVVLKAEQGYLAH